MQVIGGPRARGGSGWVPRHQDRVGIQVRFLQASNSHAAGSAWDVSTCVRPPLMQQKHLRACTRCRCLSCATVPMPVVRNGADACRAQHAPESCARHARFACRLHRTAASAARTQGVAPVASPSQHARAMRAQSVCMQGFMPHLPLLLPRLVGCEVVPPNGPP